MNPPLNAAENVYARIKQRILDGDLEGGRMVSEGELAAEYGVSRTPVREAFLRLQSEGWMRLYPKRGALVVEAPADEIGHVLDARWLLETHAVDHVADDDLARTQLIAALTDYVTVQREAADRGDDDAFFAADVDFHHAIMAAGDNPLLAGFAEGLRERQRRITASAVRTPARMAAVVADHEELIAAIAAADAERFRRALDAHFTGTHGRAGAHAARREQPVHA